MIPALFALFGLPMDTVFSTQGIMVLLLMAMIGAIVLARRDLLVDDPTTGQPTETELALPERPKELAGTDR